MKHFLTRHSDSRVLGHVKRQHLDQLYCGGWKMTWVDGSVLFESTLFLLFGKCKKSVIQSHIPSNNWWFFKQTSKCLFRESVCFAHYYQMSVQMKVVPKDREWQVVEIWYSPDCMFSSWNVLTQTDRSDQPKYSLLIE